MRDLRFRFGEGNVGVSENKGPCRPEVAVHLELAKRD